jgi:parallel beta-helix repeat protein
MRAADLDRVTLVWLGLAAVASAWIAERRPLPPEQRGRVTFTVSSERDAGPGSLREAIFSSFRAQGRARIELRVPRIVLDTPLPPFLTPDGVAIDGLDGGVEIDASALPSGPVLDLAAPSCVVRGVRIRGGGGTGILVRGAGTRLSGLDVRGCGDGVSLAEGVGDLAVEESVFEDNVVGVRLPASASAVTLRGTRFARHEQAGVWAVSPAPSLGGARTGPLIRDCRFLEERIGIVLINVPAQVEGSHFDGSRESAVHFTGSVALRRNRVTGGESFGFLGNETDGAVVEDNEIDGNLIGMLLRQAKNTTVQRNRVYQNSFGIVVVFGPASGALVVAENMVLDQHEDAVYVIGASPLLQDNRIVGNRGVAVRSLDFVPRSGPRITALPVLRGNVLERNRTDGLVKGEYRVPETGK